jgi:hypothetical protein
VSHFVGRALRLITSEADCYPIPGARVSVPLNDRTGRLMWTGCYELELVTFLQAMLGPGSTRRLRGVRYGMADHGCGFCSGSSGDREALSVALEEVLSDGLIRYRLCESRRRAQLHHFSWNAIASRYADTLVRRDETSSARTIADSTVGTRAR